MRFWTAISCIAGALQRKVWISQGYFHWYPNFYIVYVAPPGIVSKTTTMDTGLNLLRQVPEVQFGPDVVTWQALVGVLENAQTKFIDKSTGEEIPQAALTFASGELGNLIKPTDKESIDMLVSLWDGKDIKKVTKGSGSETVQNPCLNMIGCTTPSWIADNFAEYMIGGGFTTRCVFIYADTKAQVIAYPSRNFPKYLGNLKNDLIHDLQHITTQLIGEYTISEEAFVWGEAWYKKHIDGLATLEDSRFQGYAARKQTHMHKLAMILAAAKRDELIIEKEDLEEALQWLNRIEKDMPLVFSLIGRSTMSLYAERFITAVHASVNGMPLAEAYRKVHQYFPDQREFDAVVAGAVGAGYVQTGSKGTALWVFPTGKKPGASRGAIMKGVDNV